MKNLYTKIALIVLLMAGFNQKSNAQDWMVGDAINDTIKYLVLQPLLVTDSTTCYEEGQYSWSYYIQPSIDAGITYGYVVQEITGMDTIDIQPNGVVAEGDTLYFDWAIQHEVSFYGQDAGMTLRFFAEGEVTIPGLDHPCGPADSLWMMQLPVCAANTWFNFNCVTQPNPLSVNEIDESYTSIEFPNYRNGMQMIVDTQKEYGQMSIYDISGKVMTQSSTNRLDCNDLPSGTYILAIEFSSGIVEIKKFALIK